MPIMNHSLRLYCLPFAGGNIYSYRKLANFLAPHIIFAPLELPGRGKRLHEPLLTHLDAMVADLLRQITPHISEPYAVYGHSMGALLGYLLTGFLQQQHLPLPRHLFVSGRQSPGIPERTERLHALPDAEFLQKLQEFGGIPDAIAREQELLAFFLPVFRADFQAIEAYDSAINAPLLSVPLTILFGSDEHFCERDVRHWQNLTTAAITFHQFSGNHFFIFDHLEAVGTILSRSSLR